MRCFICVLIMYSPFRQSMNMFAGLLGYLPLIILKVACIAINSTLKMFCRLDSLTASSIFWIDYIHHILLFLLSNHHPFVVVGRKNRVCNSNTGVVFKNPTLDSNDVEILHKMRSLMMWLRNPLLVLKSAFLSPVCLAAPACLATIAQKLVNGHSIMLPALTSLVY